MKLELNERQKEAQAEFRTFVDAEIVPLANRCDREEHTPIQLIEKLAKKGYLGAIIPKILVVAEWMRSPAVY
jgi:alkylation response protein AidB-like acyl-CoA dehydrogenase